MNDIIQKDGRYWMKAEVKETLILKNKYITVDGRDYILQEDAPIGEVLVEVERKYFEHSMSFDINNKRMYCCFCGRDWEGIDQMLCRPKENEYELKSPLTFYKEGEATWDARKQILDSLERIGTFCEKCRQVVCICNDSLTIIELRELVKKEGIDPDQLVKKVMSVINKFKAENAPKPKDK